jgi:hypothetical protein
MSSNRGLRNRWPSACLVRVQPSSLHEEPKAKQL